MSPLHIFDQLYLNKSAEILLWTSPDPVPKRTTKTGKGETTTAPTLMEQFIGNKKGTNFESSGDVVMNEDGTMYAAGVDENDDDDLE